jgi:hydroxypyruvate isomerase
MKQDSRSTRRSFTATVLGGATAAAAQDVKTAPRKGRLKQAVCGGVFGRGVPLEERCRIASKLGVVGHDLVGPRDWATVRKYGLIVTMASGSGSGIREGINRVELHDRIEKQTRELIDLAAQQGVPNIILLTGERRGMSDQQGLDNCVAFLNKIKAQAEDKGVTLCTELLNSKVDHPDYMCDHTAWGVEMCKRVNSPRVKLLYDIYHMQIMEGDVIRTIRNNIQYIGHFHTAGNPGRHEMDDTQEMNYRGIARAIADLGYTGYIAHEYSPVRDPLKSLEETLSLFEV